MKRFIITTVVLLCFFVFNSCKKEIPINIIDNRTSWSIDELPDNFNTLTFIDENIGLMSSYSTIVLTKNHGEYWETINNTIGFSTIESKDNLLFGINDNLFISQDTGYSWNNLVHEIFDSYDKILSYNILNKDTIFIEAHSGLYRTYDAGSNWTILKGNYNDTLRIVSNPFFLKNQLYIFRNFSNYDVDDIFDLLFFSEDLGDSWLDIDISQRMFVTSNDTIYNHNLEIIQVENINDNFLIIIAHEFDELGVRISNNKYIYRVDIDFNTWEKLNFEIADYELIDYIIKDGSYYFIPAQQKNQIYSITASNIELKLNYPEDYSLGDFYLFNESEGCVLTNYGLKLFTF